MSRTEIHRWVEYLWDGVPLDQGFLLVLCVFAIPWMGSRHNNIATTPVMQHGLIILFKHLHITMIKYYLLQDIPYAER